MRYLIITFMLLFTGIILKANPAYVQLTDTLPALQSKAYQDIDIVLRVTDPSISRDFVLRYLGGGPCTRASKPKQVKTSTKREDGYYFRITPSSHLGYFSLGDNEEGFYRHLLYRYIVEPGDSITITVSRKEHDNLNWSTKGNDLYFAGSYYYKDYDIAFSGRGVEKYNCRWQMDKICYTLNSSGIIIDGQYNSDNMHDVARDISLDIIRNFKLLMGEHVFQTMKVNVMGKYGMDKYKEFRQRLIGKEPSSPAYKDIIGIYKERFQPLWPVSADEKYVYSSSSYLSYMLTGLEFDAAYMESEPLENVYLAIKNGFQGKVRDYLITTFLLEGIGDIKNWHDLMDDAQKIVKTEFCVEELTKMKKLFNGGMDKFDYELTDQNGETVNLNDFGDKVVVIDFWFTGCTGCRYFYGSLLSKIEEDFKDNKEIVFVSVSVDASREKWLAGLKSNKYTSESAINLFTGEQRSNHPIIKDSGIKTYPSLIVLRTGNMIHRMIRDPNKWTQTELEQEIMAAFN